jgi:hypothetical protein
MSILWTSRVIAFNFNIQERKMFSFFLSKDGRLSYLIFIFIKDYHSKFEYATSHTQSIVFVIY